MSSLMSPLHLPLSSLEYFLNLLASFNPYLKDVLLNSAQGSLVVAERRPKWLQKTCWGRSGRHQALLLLWGRSQWAHQQVQELLLVHANASTRQEAAGHWGGYLGTGSGGWRKEGSAFSIVDGLMLEIFPWGMTMLSDNKSWYKPIQCMVHMYTHIHTCIYSESHVLTC